MSTTGHESELISVSGLKASLQKLKTNKIDTKIDKAAVDNKNAILAYGQQSTVATVGTTDIKVTMPTEPTLVFDQTPTENSNNPVTSKGIKSAIEGAIKDQHYYLSGIKRNSIIWQSIFLHNTAFMKAGVIIDSNFPNITPSPSYRISDYLSVKPGMKVTLHVAARSESAYIVTAYTQKSQSSVVPAACFKGSETTGDFTYTVPAGVNYIRITDSFSATDANYAMFYNDEIAQNVLDAETKEELSVSVTNVAITKDSFPNTVSDQYYRTTGYIPVSEGETYLIRTMMKDSGFYITGYTTQSQSSIVDSFSFVPNAERLLLETTQYVQEETLIQIPTGVNYIRISTYKDSPKIDGTTYKFEKINADINFADVEYELYDVKNRIQSIETPVDFLENDYKRAIKFPYISPRKACVIFQMDGNPSCYHNLSDFEDILSNNGISKFTLAALPSTFSTYGSKIREMYEHGHEIAIHGEGTETNFESVLQGYYEVFSSYGIIPYGYVEMSTNISAANLAIAKNYFSWIVKNGGDYDPLTQDFLNSVNSISDKPYLLKRLSIDMNHTDVGSKQQFIADIKSAIDYAIANKGVLVLYGHSLDTTSDTTYTIHSDVLESISAYVKQKMDKGLCVIGGTADILNYYYNPRIG